MKINTTIVLIFIVFILVWATSCNNHVKIHVEGLVDSIDGVKVRITNIDNTVAYDSTVVKGKKFNLNSALPSPGFYTLEFVSPTASFHGMKWLHPCFTYVENNSRYKFYAVGPDEIISDHYKISSTSLNEQKFEQYRAQWNVKRKETDSLIRMTSKKRDYYLSIGDHNAYNNFSDTLLFLDSLKRNLNTSVMREFIRVNNNTVITPYFITQMSDFSSNYNLYKNTLDGLTPEVKNTKYFEQASNLLKAFEKIRIGKEVPAIAGRDKFGEPFNNKFSKYKYTLIDFWASYCYPCREEFPELKTIFNKYKDKGFSIVSVSIDRKKDWWLYASLKDSLPWCNVCEAVKQEDSKNIENFAVTTIPMNYLVNEKGQLIAKDIDLTKLSKLLSSRLNQDDIHNGLQHR